MRTIGTHRFKTELSKILKEVRQGESFTITKAGKPIAKLTGSSALTGKKPRRLGFLKDEFLVPDDFDRMGSAEIEKIFGGHS